MKYFEKPWEAASVLVRLGGILQLCCESPGGKVEPLQQPKVSSQPTYRSIEPLPYHQSKIINSPEQQNERTYLRNQNGNIGVRIDIRDHNRRNDVIQIKRNIPGYRWRRIDREDDDFKIKNILHYRDSRTGNEPRGYRTTAQDKTWIFKDTELSSTMMPINQHTQINSNYWVITDTPSISWDSTHWIPGERFTILPTISVVRPWDHIPVVRPPKPNIVSNIFASESNVNPTFIQPTPVSWKPIIEPKQKAKTIQQVDLPRNLTGRFFDMLRTVVTSAEIAEKNLSYLAEDAKREKIHLVKLKAVGQPIEQHLSNPVEYHHSHQQESGWNLFRQSEDSLVDTSNLEPMIIETELSEEKGISFTPLLQICVVMGIAVLAMILLFHHQHFRRDCLVERRVLKHLQDTVKHQSSQAKTSQYSSSESEQYSSASSIINIEPPVKVKDVTL